MLHARFQDNGALHALGLMKGWSADAADFDECCLWVSEVHLPGGTHFSSSSRQNVEGIVQAG
jgi:hypothetical protein